MQWVWSKFCYYPDRDIYGDHGADESEKEFAILPHKLPREHIQPFARLCAATWREAGLPITSGNGKSREPLERWFSDRIRKQVEFW
jgi:hypothetical protein